MILTLRENFSSAHLYFQPQWSAEKNLQNFGRCFTEHGHGHNYVLEVSFKVSESNLPEKKKSYQTLLKELCSRLDHEHLNFVIPEFKKIIPTTENILLYFEKKLKDSAAGPHLAGLKLFEMKDLWTEIRYE
ncbi:MAG TPA: 6-carboxytetrahydropterin synthase [Bdellovibrio sp.]|nr:6-carboxytetrahydropterin synthase [Bdellovibrio sp.]